MTTPWPPGNDGSQPLQQPAPSHPQYPAQQWQAPISLPYSAYPSHFHAPGPGPYFDGALHVDELRRPLYGANPGQAFIRFFKNYANFTGRASRSEFWWMVLLFWGAFIMLLAIAGVAASASDRMPADRAGSYLGMAIGLVLWLMLLGTVIPWLAVSWRRLHDANLPGPLWFLVFVPYLGGLTLIVLCILSPSVQGRRFDHARR